MGAIDVSVVQSTTGTYVGNNFTAAVSSSSKATGKASMDGGLVVQWDLEESVLDHAFQCLGINTETVDHPIVMTEALCNPNVSRAHMSELLFEAYGCPRVAYGVDALFSHYYNRPQHAQHGTSLIVSAGHHASYIIPVIGGRVDPTHARRVDVGGAHVLEYSRSLLMARYPSLEADFTPPMVQAIVHRVGACAGDYTATIRRLADRNERDAHAARLQLPVDPSHVPTEEDLLRQQQLREERAARMRRMLKQRDEKRLAENKQRLAMLKELQEHLEELEDEEETNTVLAHYNFDSTKALVREMHELKRKVRTIERRLQDPNKEHNGNDDDDDDDDDDEEEEEEEDGNEEEDKYYLLSRSVDELTPEERSLRKKQLFLKNMAEAREKMKIERQEQKRIQAEERARMEEKIKNDLQGFLDEKRREHKLLQEELRVCQRQRRELSDRHSGASKARMRLLVQQTQMNPAKRAKGDGEEDDFGMRDSDWLVYSEISKEQDQSREEMLQQRIEDVEAAIEKYDPNSATNRPKTREGLLEQLRVSRQLSLSVERFQFPEVLFQPPMTGVDQSGLGACFDLVLPRYAKDVQRTLAQNVFVTGGTAQFPGFQQRIHNELRLIRPFEEPIKIFKAKDVSLDAWRGAAVFASSTDNLERFTLTKALYEEAGLGYFVEHFASNRHYLPLQ
ncbi:hypothetical protein PTSG_04268 [Salpingoeca rosetta]|uniref:Actin-related protein 5 n=1 Tax=Salpingoeca rosetta (strain ATCC 50818 / BSB-021) TaxID=946362 RepID=F2U731_SALR5|nr:uncharacterized protein PTSG_04268 [Salpingoeca rosetta]EGD83663.1 hypothetical protein PTSG_04268 [Salpingoeca rosetta]|eukprot:XP_004995167.1 hypothetical protein PTSG_04268 [Salpingoeca rosetta]